MPDYDDLRLKYNYGNLENPPYYVTAYGIAVKHGYQGTEEEWIHEVQESAHDSSIAAAASAEAAAGSADTAEAFGAGTRGGEPLEEEDPAYHNNAQYYSDHAEAYGAGTRGGEPVEEDDPAYHNNAQYFAGQAQATADGLDARLDAQDTAIATIRSQVASPYVIAATGAAMTDQTKAYVYVGDGTGDDAGLVNGAWYYYDADAEVWTQGGTATDPTLSVAGAAADAKATGELKNHLIIDNNYNYLVKHPFNSTTSKGITFTRQEDGSVKVAGTTIDSSAYGYYFNATNKYPSFITPGKQYYIDFHGVNVQLRIAIYKDGEWASPIVKTKEPCVFEVPSELTGFRIQLFVMGNGTVVNETVCPKIVEIKAEEQKKFERDIIGAAPDNEISVLFVGNSLTQDGIAYLPWLLRTYYPEVNFRFYMWYMGSYTLADHYTCFLNNGSAQRFSVAENTASWTNYVDSKTMAQILSSYTFNIVCMQESFNNKSEYTDADLTDWNNCRDYITSNYHGGNALEFISLFHAPARLKADDAFNWIKSGNELILKKTVSQDMLSNGIAIYRALSTDLDNLGDLGHLSPDGIHAQEGLPCLLQSYVAAMWIFDRVGLTKSVYGCPARITTEIYNSINVPGPNLGSGIITGTDAQNLLAQEVAIKAYKEGLEIVNATETTSEQTLISMQKSILNDTHIQWFIGKNINSEGIIQNNTSAALSNIINVSEGTQIKRIGSAVDSSQKTLFLYVDAFENMVFKNRTKLNKFEVYTVPSDVDAICFGFARAVGQGVDMTVQDVENYFGVEWKFATASYTALKSGNGRGEYLENMFEKFCVFGSGSSNGIDYDLIDSEAHSYYVHGSTSDSISFYNLYNGLLPGCLERGKSYFVFYENSAEARNCHARFLFYDKDGNVTQPASSGYPYAVTIPDNAFSVVFRLYVARNQTVDTTIKYLKLVEVQEQKMSVPYIISFVDDDASSTTYVERYYNSCKRNGINGNYAVITNHWDRGATDPDLLIDYEDDGMAMLIHCSEQSYSLAPEWMDRDYDECRKNLYKGMRAMQEKGFVNFRYWVMPYGYVNDDFKRLATDAGMKCMISSANFKYNNIGDADRYYIKRYSLDPIDSETGIGTLATIKTAIDEMQNLPSCWMLITTHFNEWGSVTWDSTVDETGYPVGYARMNEIIQYAKASGAAVLTVPEAWRFYEPIIEANEERYNKIRP